MIVGKLYRSLAAISLYGPTEGLGQIYPEPGDEPPPVYAFDRSQRQHHRFAHFSAPGEFLALAGGASPAWRAWIYASMSGLLVRLTPSM